MMSGYVKDTDYAGADKGGTIKTGWYNFGITSGHPMALTTQYANYAGLDAASFISKGTLENVVTGKGLVKDTDYGTDDKGGSIKSRTGLGFNIDVYGRPYASGFSYSNYGSIGENAFISKSTLENVITGKGILSTNDVKNNVVSTDTDKPLSANMGKELNDRIQNLASIGKYLAMWDCTTGLPTTNPVTMPYTYTTGDYYVISNVGATNYMPNGSSYSGTASSTQYSGTETLAVGDFFYYDGTVWTMLKNTGKTVYFANIAGNPTDNINLASALNGKVGFTNYATTTNAGVIKVGSAYGTTMVEGGILALWSAQNADIDAKTSSRKPVVPSNLDYAVKIGVTTNTNTLTDTEKTNACTWLGTGKMVKISQSDYDDLVDGGTVDSNTYYFIEEE